MSARFDLRIWEDYDLLYKTPLFGRRKVQKEKKSNKLIVIVSYACLEQQYDLGEPYDAVLFADVRNCYTECIHSHISMYMILVDI